MGWMNAIEDTPGLDNEGLGPLERAARLKQYAQMVVKLHKEGRYDPKKTALSRAMGLRSSQALDGLADEMDTFTPAQQAQLRRLAASLRAFVLRTVQAHDHGPGTRPARMRRPARARRPRRLTSVPIEGWDPDDDGDGELGILPAIPAILGAAAPLIGGLLGGGDKGGGGAAAPASPVAASAGAGVNLPAIGGVVADQIRAVPPPVRQQVTDAVREIMDKQKAGQMDVTAMMKQIADLMGPKLKAQLESVNKAALQRQATFEHNALKTRDERWKQNQKAQQAILTRVNEMEQRLGAAVVEGNKRKKAVARAFGIPPRYQ